MITLTVNALALEHVHLAKKKTLPFFHPEPLFEAIPWVVHNSATAGLAPFPFRVIETEKVNGTNLSLALSLPYCMCSKQWLEPPEFI